ncbi:MAG TPA: AIR synthase related protein, partial [Nitrolancea sp.]|nr:AIR synthase related protein [Nitrolancea sp.]
RIKGTPSGLALKTDCNPRYCYLDPYLGGMHAVAEAARNVSCVGAQPLAITNCLNFGNPEKPEVYYQLERAVAGMAAACRALETPVVSGNVSLYNESGAEAIYPTPTVGMVGLLADVRRRVGLALQTEGVVYLVGPVEATLGASEYLSTIHGKVAGAPPALSLPLEFAVQDVVRSAIERGLVAAAHDCSEGGLAVALAESCLADGVGGRFTLQPLLAVNQRLDRTLFGEAASRIVVQAQAGQEAALERALAGAAVPFLRLGAAGGERLELPGFLDIELAALQDAWSAGLR